MLNAHPVREPPQSKGRADEVMKLPGAVKGRGIEINMVMQMALVNVGTDEKLILALCPAHGRFIADFVGLPLHGPARFRLVLAFCQKKLGGGRYRIAEIGGHGSQLFRIEPIGKPLLHRLNGAFSRRYLVGSDVSCSRGRTSFSKKDGGCAPAAKQFCQDNLARKFFKTSFQVSNLETLLIKLSL